MGELISKILNEGLHVGQYGNLFDDEESKILIKAFPNAKIISDTPEEIVFSIGSKLSGKVYEYITTWNKMEEEITLVTKVTENGQSKWKEEMYADNVYSFEDLIKIIRVPDNTKWVTTSNWQAS